jgi:hypothetical protein
VKPLVIRFAAAAAGVISIWISGVLALNATIYSPSRFAEDYFAAVAVGDWSQAVALAGVADEVDVLPSDDQLISGFTVSGWQHVGSSDVVVQVDVVLNNQPERIVIELRRTSRLLGVFDQWAFSEAPLASISAQVSGVPAVTINDTSTAPATTLNALVPGVYSVHAWTQWVESEGEEITLATPGESVRVPLSLSPTAALEDEVRAALGEYLAECAARGVLQPASCPFGTTVSDRLVGVPSWTISVPPAVAVVLSRSADSAEVGAVGGVATVTGTIQSIFDGSLRPLNRDIAFGVTGVVTELSSESPALRID